MESHASLQAYPQAQVTSVCFDHLQEILWTGLESGDIRSYVIPGCEVYTFRETHQTPVCSLYTDKRLGTGLISCSLDQIKYMTRGLITIWSTNEQSICSAPIQTNELILSNGNLLKICNLHRGKITREIYCSQVTKIEPYSNNVVVLAHKSGTVTLLDTRIQGKMTKVPVQAGIFNDICLIPNGVLTCGYHLGVPHVATVDFRKTAKVLALDFDAQLLCSMESKCVAVNEKSVFLFENGFKNVAELPSPPSSLCASQTGDYVAIGDVDGFINLFLLSETQKVNHLSDPVLVPSALPQQNEIQWSDDDVPFNFIGLPSYDSTLLSGIWPDVLHSRGLPSSFIDPLILDSAKQRGSVMFADRHNSLRNIWPYKQQQFSKFKSQKSVSELSLSLDDLTIEDYKAVQIEYSKFGIMDFDFDLFNQTNFSGLETGLPNCYLNNFLQILYFSYPFNQNLIEHSSKNCEKQDCLCCELGFLFKMLHQKVKTCRAFNFCNVFGRLKETKALQLLENPKIPFQSLSLTIQNCARFLLEHVSRELELKEYTFECTVSLECLKCKNQRQKDTKNLTLELNYPGLRNQNPKATLQEIIKNTIYSCFVVRSFCENCRMFCAHNQSKQNIKIPDVLHFTTGVSLDLNSEWWCQKDKVFQRYIQDPFLSKKIHLDQEYTLTVP